MHTVVFYVAIVWLTLLLGAGIVLVIGARSVLTRIITLDMLILILVALLAVFSDSEGVPYLLDAALALAVLSFTATLAAARFHAKGRLFS